MQQVTVGRVQLHAVEPCLDRVPRALDNFLQDAGQFVGGQGVRHGVRLLALGRAGLRLDGDGAGRNYLVAAGDVLVRNPATVHDLREDPAAFGVNGVRDLLPAGNLVRGDDAGLARVRAPGRARIGALADDQAQ